jgi:hypothetical protein
MKAYPLVLLCLALLAQACSRGIPKDDKGREDFKAFYDKFHKDSLFQLERIDFDALNVQEGRFEEKYKAETWTMLKHPAKDDDVVTEIQERADDLIKVYMVYGNSFLLERHFNLNPQKQWIMTYYSGMKAYVQTNSTPGGEEYKRRKDSLQSVQDSSPIKVTGGFPDTE